MMKMRTEDWLKKKRNLKFGTTGDKSGKALSSKGTRPLLLGYPFPASLNVASRKRRVLNLKPWLLLR